jgi:hypothetical protein
MGANSSLSAKTKESIEEIWTTTNPNLEGIFSENFIENILADESFHPQSSTEHGLSPHDISETMKAIQLKGASLDVGVPPDEVSSVVEQLLLELSVACSRKSTQAHIFNKRKLVLQGLHDMISASVPDASKEKSKDKTQPKDEVVGNQWPSEYIATQQLGLSLLCSFLEAIPINSVPIKPLLELMKTLEGLGPLRLYNDWSGPQRSYAEREIDLLNMVPPPEPNCSSCNSAETSGPKKPLQPGSSYWCSRSKREHSQWGLKFLGSSSITISSIILIWHKASLPERVDVKISSDRGANFKQVTSMLVPSRDSAEMLISFNEPLVVTDLLLDFSKFAKCNVEGSKCHKL